MRWLAERGPPAGLVVASVLRENSVPPPYPFQRPIGSMKSMPAASAMRARRRQSGQLADHRSGTVVAQRPEEQLAPKIPILSALGLYMAMRSRIDAERASTAVSIPVKPIAHPCARLLHARVLACRIGPAQRRRENHVH